jgi:hypothetical protein
MGGSDGDRLREIDVVDLPLIPFLHLERLLRSRQRSGIGRYATTAKGPRIPREQWSEIVDRVQREGLRAVARDLGVSHETVRAVVKRVEQWGHCRVGERLVVPLVAFVDLPDRTGPEI